MNNSKKTIVILMSVILCSCSEKVTDRSNISNSEKTNTNPPTSAPVSSTATESGIDGYKELKFGMSSIQLAQTESCKDSYIYFSDIKYLPRKIEETKARVIEHPFQEKIDFLKRTIKDFQKSNDNTQEKISNGSFVSLGERATHEDNIKRLLQMQDDLKQLELQATNVREHPEETFRTEVQPLIDKLNFAQSYDPTITDQWVKSQQAICTTNFMGFKKDLRPLMTNEKLSGVTINIGAFDNDTYQSIAKGLSAKYPVAYIPSDSQISAFNTGKIRRIANTFSNGQVVLSVDSNWGTKILQLNYFDPNSAQEYAKTITQGVLVPGDI